ncbi:MAG: ABC transporter substrate-binding protein, partial [Alphaproteobacteria bacterium]|nr:ABC transporter substrate-binding protein [Alphaproteobacteria bacterium]
SLYALTAWVQAHQDEAQRLADAMVRTLQWIQTHSPEEVMAKMPKAFTSADPKTYLASLKSMIPTFSATGLMDPKGAEAVLAVFSQSVAEIKNAHIDVTQTYTNAFVEKADAKLGVKG